MGNTKQIRKEKLRTAIPEQAIIDLSRMIMALNSEVEFGLEPEVERRTAQIIQLVNDKRHALGWRLVQ